MNQRGFAPIIIVGIVVAILVVVGGAWYFVTHNTIPQNAALGGVACTQEAKQCPDGSYVGRTGPNCEFAACPGAGNSSSSQTEGLIRGMVVLAPACPVEHNPPDPQCAPKPYQTSISISKNIETPETFLTIQSNASGTFSVLLPVGEYVFHPQGGSRYPQCDEKLVTVAAENANNITISCDTGIR